MNLGEENYSLTISTFIQNISLGFRTLKVLVKVVLLDPSLAGVRVNFNKLFSGTHSDRLHFVLTGQRCRSAMKAMR